jgi:UDP-glucose-4-epimerase GalE
MRVLVVGGAGYIGSHICKALAVRGDEPIVFDNLSAGHERAVQWGPLFRGDVRDKGDVLKAFSAHQPNAVMHFAANIEVGEGEREPLAFWENNVGGVISLLSAMEEANCDKLVFSSTCATYGMPETLPLTENEPQAPINVYGRTKLAVERMLADVSCAKGLRYAALRYFNASGASPDGEIGEEHAVETHLIPLALRAAAGLGDGLKVFGSDYDTPDGTCIRDYIHVSDLAAAHLAALDCLFANEGGFACNVGTGHGYSVKEVLDAVEAVTGRKVPHELCDRRAGDPPRLYADVTLSRELLAFKPVRSDLETIVRDAWNFHRQKWEVACSAG